MNLGEDVVPHKCRQPGGEGGYKFSLAQKNPGFIGIEDIQKTYLPIGFSNFKIEGRGGFANRLTHILYHLQDHKENIKAIMYGETEKLFTSYFRDYLEQTFCDDLVAHSEVPKAFAIQFFTGSFCETIKWWINSDMQMPPEEVVENYQKMIKFR